ncbi:MAG TPA: hypothetical protein VGH87_16045, partial [Polyangiaceae bacterium]
VVPILCGLGEAQSTGRDPASFADAESFLAALSGLVAEHFVCFSDPTCQDSARTGLVVTDVTLGVVTLGVIGAAAFLAAVMHGLNN